LSHKNAVCSLAASSAAVLLIGVSLGSHNAPLHVTEQHDVWVHEANGNNGTNPVHEQDQAQDGFDSKPNGRHQDKELFELEGTKQTQRVANDANHKGRNHETESFKSRSVQLGSKTDQTEDGKTKGDDVDGDDSSSSVAAKETEQNERN
jgi:hypothetical protein